MPTYTIETEQKFYVTYDVKADSAEEAWEKLIDLSNDAECEDQIPGEIIGAFEGSSIMLGMD